MSQMSNSNAIRLSQPGAGQTVTVPVDQSNMRMALGFAPDPNAVVKNGQDLEFTFEDGGKIVLQGYYDHFTSKTLPTMVTESGDELPGEDFLASLREDLLTAAGPGAGAGAPGSGSGEYADDPGALINGIDRLGSLGTIYWGHDYEVPEQYLNENPAGSGDISVITDLTRDPYGRIEVGVFEDARPYQHLESGQETYRYGQMQFAFAGSGTTVCDFVNMTGFHVGTVIYLGDPTDPNTPTITITSETEVVRIPAGQFSGNGVFLEPPANSDADMDITSTLEIRATSSGFTATIDGPSFVVVVDAVADLPINVAAELGTVGLEGALGLEENGNTEQTVGDGWFKDSFAKDGEVDASPVKVFVEFKATIEFFDYKDGSESHYALVEVPSAANANRGGLDSMGEWKASSSDPNLTIFDETVTIYFAKDGTVLGEGVRQPDGSITLLNGGVVTPADLAGGDVTSKEYFKVEVSNAAIAADPAGKYDVTLTLENEHSNLTEDTTFSLDSGSMASENVAPGERELSGENNNAYAVGENLGKTQDLTVDTIDSKLTVKTGWASEDGDNSKHITGSYEPGKQGGMYNELADPADKDAGNRPGVEAASTNADASAPVVISISGGDASGVNAEEITVIRLYFDADAGDIRVGNTALAVQTDGKGSYVELTVANGGIAAGGQGTGNVNFLPKDTYNDGDVKLTYEVEVVAQPSGASAVYKGETTVVIDAVADLPNKPDIEEPHYDKHGGDFVQTAAQPGQPVNLKGSATFADNDGSETHYLVVNLSRPDGQGWSIKGLEDFTGKLLTKDGVYNIWADKGTENLDGAAKAAAHDTLVDAAKANGEALHPTSHKADVPEYLVFEVSRNDDGSWDVRALVADGNGARIDVTDKLTAEGAQFSYSPAEGLKYSFDLVAPENPKGDLSAEINTMAATVEVPGNSDLEYDYANNISWNGGRASTTVTVAPAQSDLAVTTNHVYEGNAANKHGAKPGDADYVSEPGNGYIKLALTGNTFSNGRADNDYIQRVYLEYASQDGSSHGKVTVTLGGVTHDVPSGAVLTFTASGTAGGETLYTLSINGVNCGTCTMKQLADGLLKYTPNSGDYSDLDVNINYAVAIVDPDSGDTKVVSNIKDFAKTGSYDDLVKGSVDSDIKVVDNKPATEVMVDAVADQAKVGWTGEPGDNVDYPDYPADHPKDGEKPAAKPGDTVTLRTNVQFSDTEDGSEEHFVIVQKDATITNITVTDSQGNVIYDGPAAGLDTDPKGNWMIPVANNDGGVFTVAVDVKIPDNASSDNNKSLKIGGYSHETEDTTPADEYTTKNNDAWATDTVKYQVQAVDTKSISVGVGQATENATPKANIGKEHFREAIDAKYNSADPAEHAEGVKLLKEGGAAISITAPSGFAANEAITNVVLKFAGVDGAPAGQIMYNNVLVDLPVSPATSAATTIGGVTVTCSVDGNGAVTVTIPSGQAVGNLYFVPTNNYSHADVDLKYAVTVTDSQSDQSKVFSNDATLLDGKIPGTNAAAPIDTSGKQHIDVDAVAHKPVMDNETYTGTGDDGQAGYTTVAPGNPANISFDVRFQDFDGTESHYVFVEHLPGWKLGDKVTLSLVDAGGNTHSITITLTADMVTQQNLENLADNIGEHAYWRIEIPNSTLQTLDGFDGDGINGSSTVTVTVPVTTPANVGNGSSASLHVGAGSVEDADKIANGDTELNPNNNQAFTGGKFVNVTFETADSARMKADGYYEDSTPDAHRDILTENAAVALNITGVTDANDHVTSFTFGLTDAVNDAALGKMYFFDSQDDYNAYLVAHANGTGDAYLAANATLIEYGKTYDFPQGFNGQVVFQPNKGAHFDGDLDLKYDIAVKDFDSGDVKHSADTFTLRGDAVAQKPTSVAAADDTPGENNTYGSVITTSISANFTDLDGSEGHYVLLEVKANWKVELLDKNGNPLSSNGDWEIYTPKAGGPSYYMIPVGNDTAKQVTVDLRFTAPEWSPSQPADFDEFKYGAMAREKVLVDNEITYHNNTAVTDGGTLDFNVSGGSGHGPHIWVRELYEDNNPNAHLPGNADPGASHGKLDIASPNGTESIEITIKDVGADGKPIAVILVNGQELTPDANGTFTIPTPNGVVPADVEIKLQPNYADRGEDFDITYTFRDSQGNAIGSEGKHHVVVDAVADLPVMGAVTADSMPKNTATEHDAIADGTNKTVEFTVDVTFPDHDPSELHWVLVEQQPGWVPEGPYDTISTIVDGKPMTFFRILVDDNKLDADGNGTITVRLVVDPNTMYSETDNKGVHHFELQVGAMAQETNSGTGGDMEITAGNNAAITFGDTVDVLYSPVDSHLGISVGTAYEHNELKDGVDAGGAKITLGGLASGASDELIALSLNVPADRGHIEIDGVTFSGGALNAAQMAAVLAGKAIFVPEGYGHGNVELTWTASVRDTVSGEVRNDFGGKVAIAIDAVAHGSENTYAGIAGVQTSGGHAFIGVETKFEDTTNSSEAHWVVLQKHTNYLLEGVTVNGQPYTGEVVTMIGKDQTVYYAVKVTGASDKVVFEVRTPATSGDQEHNLKAGTISVETTEAGEASLINNWTENVGARGFWTGILETKSLSVSGKGEEDGYCPLTFTSDMKAAYHETLAVTIKAADLQGGELYQKVSGQWVLMAADGSGNYVLDGTSGEYAYKAPENFSGKANLPYTATVTDEHSLATKGFSGTAAVSVAGVADAPASIEQPVFGQWAKVDGEHAATVSVALAGVFPDVTGENHCFLIAQPLPAGLELVGPYTTWLDGTTSYYVIPAANSAVTNATATVTFKATDAYQGDSISVSGISQERIVNSITPKTESSSVTDAAGTAPELPAPPADMLNAAPEAVDVALAVSGLDDGFSFSGVVDPADLFSDSEGDTITLTTIDNGLNPGDPGYVSAVLTDTGVTVEGQYGTLLIAADGTYTYTVHEGATVPAGAAETFYLGGVDDGGKAAADKAELTIEFDSAYSTIVGTGGNDELHGTGGNDILVGGTGDDLIYGGAGNDTMTGGDGADTFGWTETDLTNGGLDTILDFEMGSDRLLFESLFSDAPADMKSALVDKIDNDVIDITVVNSQQVQVTMEGQVVDIHLANTLDGAYTSGDLNTDAKATLLEMMISQVTG